MEMSKGTKYFARGSSLDFVRGLIELQGTYSIICLLSEYWKWTSSRIRQYSSFCFRFILMAQ